MITFQNSTAKLTFFSCFSSGLSDPDLCLLARALTKAYSTSAMNTNIMHTDIHTSMALGYDTRGMELLEPVSCVVMVSTVVTPRVIRAGTASMPIQKETQESVTMRMEGM